MRRGRRRWICAALCASSWAVLFACGSRRLPAPPYVPQPTSALLEVPYPPPPPRVENVPDAPKKEAVWIDGEWSWQGTRWSWKRGRWVVPPEGAAFSPWTTARDASGTLYVAAGAWRRGDGAEIAEPAALTTSRPNAGTVVSAEGDEVPTGPDTRLDQGPRGRREAVPPGPPGDQDGAPFDGPVPEDDDAAPDGAIRDGMVWDASPADVAIRPDALPLGVGSGEGTP